MLVTWLNKKYLKRQKWHISRNKQINKIADILHHRRQERALWLLESNKKNHCNRVRIWKKNPSPWCRSSQPRPSCPFGLHLQSKSKCEEFQDDNLRALRLKDGGEDFSVMDVLTPIPSQHCALKWEWGHLLECANHQRFHVFFCLVVITVFPVNLRCISH